MSKKDYWIIFKKKIHVLLAYFTNFQDDPFAFKVPSSPPPLAAPIARRLSVSASVAGEEGLLSCVLPEDLLLELLAERIQVGTCQIPGTFVLDFGFYPIIFFQLWSFHIGNIRI